MTEIFYNNPLFWWNPESSSFEKPIPAKRIEPDQLGKAFEEGGFDQWFKHETLYEEEGELALLTKASYANSSGEVQGLLNKSGLNKKWILDRRFDEFEGVQVFRQRGTGKLIISVRGSVTAHDWLIEDTSIFFGAENMKGLNGEKMSYRTQMVETVLKLLLTQGIQAKDILLTGHSLGGRIAQNLGKDYNIRSIGFNTGTGFGHFLPTLPIFGVSPFWMVMSAEHLANWEEAEEEYTHNEKHLNFLTPADFWNLSFDPLSVLARTVPGENYTNLQGLEGGWNPHSLDQFIPQRQAQIKGHIPHLHNTPHHRYGHRYNRLPEGKLGGVQGSHVPWLQHNPSKDEQGIRFSDHRPKRLREVSYHRAKTHSELARQ